MVIIGYTTRQIEFSNWIVNTHEITELIIRQCLAVSLNSHTRNVSGVQWPVNGVRVGGSRFFDIP